MPELPPPNATQSAISAAMTGAAMAISSHRSRGAAGRLSPAAPHRTVARSSPRVGSCRGPAVVGFGRSWANLPSRGGVGELDRDAVRGAPRERLVVVDDVIGA